MYPLHCFGPTTGPSPTRNSWPAALKSAECRLLLPGQEIALARQQIRAAWSTHPATATRWTRRLPRAGLSAARGWPGSSSWA